MRGAVSEGLKVLLIIILFVIFATIVFFLISKSVFLSLYGKGLLEKVAEEASK